MRLVYGEGKLQTQQGETSDGLKCIAIKQLSESRPIKSKPAKWYEINPESSFAVVLAFKNIEGARTLQDELNELIAIWSREEGLVVDQPN